MREDIELSFDEENSVQSKFSNLKEFKTLKFVFPEVYTRHKRTLNRLLNSNHYLFKNAISLDVKMYNKLPEEINHLTKFFYWKLIRNFLIFQSNKKRDYFIERKVLTDLNKEINYIRLEAYLYIWLPCFCFFAYKFGSGSIIPVNLTLLALSLLNLDYNFILLCKVNEMARMIQINDNIYPLGRESRDFISLLNKLSSYKNEEIIVDYLVKYPEQKIIFKDKVEDFELLYSKTEYFNYDSQNVYNDYHKKLVQSLYKNRKSKEINY
jgi:hypothetical protein